MLKREQCYWNELTGSNRTVCYNSGIPGQEKIPIVDDSVCDACEYFKQKDPLVYLVELGQELKPR